MTQKKGSFLDFDFPLLFSSILLMVVGILFIYSSGIKANGVETGTEYVKQAIWSLLAIGLIFAVSLVNYNFYKDFSFYFYVILLLLLLSTLFFGKVVNGSKSWIGLWGYHGRYQRFLPVLRVLT